MQKVKGKNNDPFLLSIKGEALNSFWKGDHIGRPHVRLQKSLQMAMMMMAMIMMMMMMMMMLTIWPARQNNPPFQDLSYSLLGHRHVLSLVPDHDDNDHDNHDNDDNDNSCWQSAH